MNSIKTGVIILATQTASTPIHVNTILEIADFINFNNTVNTILQ